MGAAMCEGLSEGCVAVLRELGEQPIAALLVGQRARDARSEVTLGHEQIEGPVRVEVRGGRNFRLHGRRVRACGRIGRVALTVARSTTEKEHYPEPCEPHSACSSPRRSGRSHHRYLPFPCCDARDRADFGPQPQAAAPRVRRSLLRCIE